MHSPSAHRHCYVFTFQASPVEASARPRDQECDTTRPSKRSKPSSSLSKAEKKQKIDVKLQKACGMEPTGKLTHKQQRELLKAHSMLSLLNSIRHCPSVPQKLSSKRKPQKDSHPTKSGPRKPGKVSLTCRFHCTKLSCPITIGLCVQALRTLSGRGGLKMEVRFLCSVV